MRILGIDPGISGGACIYAPSFSVESGMRWQLIDLPIKDLRIDAAALRDFIVRFTPDHAFVEHASARPGQGVSSMFKFGRTVGAIDAAIQCCGVPITYIAPQRWKKYHGLSGSDKTKSILRALCEAPELGNLISRKRDHGRAEAALIAMYGAKCLAPI